MSSRSRIVLGSGLVLAALAGGCSSGGGEALEGSQAALSSSDHEAFDFFLGKGLTSVQAAGIVGNLDQESGMSPTAEEPGGPGRGIAQWSAGERWDSLSGDNAAWYAAKHGQSVWSLSLQLDFIWFELESFPVYGLSALERSTTVTAAAAAFATDFEACGACNESRRVAFAEAALQAYGNDSVDASPPPPPDASPSPSEDTGVACFVPSLGASGECILTSACAAMGGYVSTAGFCPGAADIECCTGPAGDTDAGM
jgi:hypothetical protein